MTGITERSHYDPLTDRLTVKKTYDAEPVLEHNKKARNAASEFGRYKGNMVHVGKLHLGDVERLRNLGYNLLSADREEVKRALLYIQREEPHLLTVPGRPFAKNRAVWV